MYIAEMIKEDPYLHQKDLKILVPTRGLVSVLRRIIYDPERRVKLFREGFTMIKTYLNEEPFGCVNIWAEDGYNLVRFIRNNEVVATEVSGHTKDGGFALIIDFPHYDGCVHIGSDSFTVAFDREDYEHVNDEAGEAVGMDPHHLAMNMLYDTPDGKAFIKKLSVYPPEADSSEWASYAPFQRAGFLVI